MQKRKIQLRASELPPLIDAMTATLDAVTDFGLKIRLSLMLKDMAQKNESVMVAARSKMKGLAEDEDPQEAIDEINSAMISVVAPAFTADELEKYGDKIQGRTVYVLTWHGLIDALPDTEDEPDADPASP